RRAAEVPVFLVREVGALGRRAEILRPLAARTGARDQLGVTDLDAGERRRRRPVAAYIDGAGRNAGGVEDRMHLAHGIGGGARGRPALRHRNDDAAGGVAAPFLREGEDGCALLRRQAAAIAADEAFDAVRAFLDRDRMPLTVIVRI